MNFHERQFLSDVHSFIIVSIAIEKTILVVVADTPMIHYAPDSPVTVTHCPKLSDDVHNTRFEKKD